MSIVLVDQQGTVIASVAEGLERKFWDVFDDRLTACVWCDKFVPAGAEVQHPCIETEV